MWTTLAAVLMSGALAAGQVAAPGAGQSGKQPQLKKQVSYAEAILRVTADPASGLANGSLIGGLLRHEPLIKSAIKKVAHDAEADSAFDLVDVEVSGIVQPDGSKLPQGKLPQGIVMLNVSVSSYDEKVPAEKLVSMIGTALADMLAGMDSNHREDECRLREQQDYVRRMADDLQKQTETLHELARFHQVALDPRQTQRDKARVQAEMQAIRVKLKGAGARRQFLERLITELEKKQVSKSGQDEVAKQLERSVQVRAKILEAAQQRPGAEILRAEDELARAQAESARYQQQLAAAAGGDRIAELQRDVQELAVEMVEQEAKGEALEEILAKVNSSTTVDQRRLDLEQLERSYRELTEDINRLRVKIRLYQSPRVTVILTN
jgi:hypothetical protein